MGLYFENLTENFSKNLNIKNHCMNEIKNYNNKKIIKIINNSNKKTENYINDTLCINFKDFKKVTNSDKKIIYKSNNLPGYQQINLTKSSLKYCDNFFSRFMQSKMGRLVNYKNLLL